MIKVSTSLTSLLHRTGAGRRARSDAFDGTSASIITQGTGAPSATFLVVIAIAAFAVMGISATPALAAGDANEAFCPHAEESPGFRTTLPDCRAYELVSPVYGSGALAIGAQTEGPENQLFASLSPDGEHLLARAFGTFAETKELSQNGVDKGALYEFSRAASGWSAEAQEPPASVYPWSIDEGWSADDLSRSVWAVSAPVPPGSEPERVWIRRNDAIYVLREGEGRFAVIGPAVAPGHEAGTTNGIGSGIDSVSSSAAHVVFTVFDELKGLWPGDGTVQGRSVYEYRGVSGGEPVLVGVKNSGAAPWNPGAPNLNDGAELLSQCGTTFDAASANGEVIYITPAPANQGPEAKHCNPQGEGTGPAVSEIYARVNGSETVKVSGNEPAQFQGASEDGSKVFFTEDETLYEYELAARRLTAIASHVTGVAQIAQDGTRIYFSSMATITTLPNANGEAANEVAGEKLYVYDTQPGEQSLAFVASGEGAGSFQTTADGRFLVFASTTRLRQTGDASTVAQLFEYDAVTGSVARFSVGQRSAAGFPCERTGTVQEGYDCDGNTNIGEDTPSLAQREGRKTVAEDGTVVFTSELPLTIGSVQGRQSIEGLVTNFYEYRAGQVYLIHPADEPTSLYQSDTDSKLYGIDESGRDIFLVTADMLVPQDTDTQGSWYDARVEGGFPAPVSPPACSGEACQGSAPATPSLSSSLAPSGVNENAAEPKPAVAPVAKPKVKTCKKGYVKKNNKCVRGKSKKKANKATNDRRAK
jgi:hypothetical protein